ncbi:glycoside hydrolase family 3 N-terminal domain-containing protein [Alloscardovia macacae]|uniref:Glycosyl hydrolase n=1 Tax=Alloscardovia macacae TaxID=1160091 RepID=A0A261F6V0_9BIFI|nr:glycoside hydrolase family 3 N-terminal domain-containing protein [Alloscardovia macacae]OZG54753.1 glycosyl hydrolase [Alloscardovia macacae]
MLGINMDDVIALIESMRTQLIVIGVALCVAIVLTVAVNKFWLKSQGWRKLIHSWSWIAATVAIMVAVSMILFGPLNTTLNLMSGSGTLSAASKARAEKLATEIQNEGVTLLENNDSSLPLADGSAVNVFGWASSNPIYGGTGSGSMNTKYPTTSLIQGLQDAGLKTNEQLTKKYTDYRADRPIVGMVSQDWSLPEPTAASYTDAEMSQAKNFSKKAIVVIGRSGGEGADLPTDMSKVSTHPAGYVSKVQAFGGEETHDYVNNGDYNDFEAGQGYLTLSKTEQDLVKLVTSNFDDVTVIYNGANAMNLNWVNDYSQIKSVLWCPPAGQTGFASLGSILAGKVNPSGKTSDTFIRDFTKAAWYNNIGHWNYENMTDFNTDGGFFGKFTPSFVNYVEGIYVGYKFFETAAAEGALNYDEAVQYPFGYGLSYTTFSQTMSDPTVSDGKVSFDVTVTNTGSAEGKTAVEVFYNPPYTNGGIEKSTANLVAFEKTKSLKPGESETVKISFNESDMASYDTRGNGGYVLEAGDYQISINSDSHNRIESKTLNVASEVRYDGSNTHNGDKTAAVNHFADADGNGSVTYLSRANGFANLAQATAAPTNTELSSEYKQSFVNSSNVEKYLSDARSAEGDVKMPTTGAKNNIQLYQLYGKDYNDSMWDKLLDQLTYEQMAQLIGYAGYNNGAIPSIGKVRQSDVDGPAALNNNFTQQGSIGLPSSTTVASTWNKNLAKEFGKAIAQMGKDLQVTGWYAPAMNIHRSPYAGRNFEYFSEDPVLSGVMASSEIKEVQDAGMYAFMKHFALNDQEDYRLGMLHTWTNEQALREIYLKPFEMSVKDGGATAVMSAFNYVGNTWAGANNALLNDVLRKEWGFNGFVLTDYFGGYGYMDATESIYNGGNAMLATVKTTNEITDKSANTVAHMREAAHGILYAAVNTYVYANGAPKVEIALWQWIYYAAVAVITLLLLWAAWVSIRRFLKRHAAEKAAAEVEAEVLDETEADAPAEAEAPAAE